MILRIFATAYLLFQVLFAQSVFSQSWKELFHVADSLREMGYGAAMPQALKLTKEALAKAEQDFGTTDSNVADVLDLYAQLLMDASISKPMEAQPYAERALQINREIFGPNHPRVGDALSILAFTGEYRKDPHRRKNLLERARTIYENAGRTHTREYATHIHNLAFTAQAEGNYTEAGFLFGKALDLSRQVYPPEYPDLAYTLTMYAVNYWNLGLYYEAEPLLREALHVWQKKYGEESMQSAICLSNLADHYSMQGKFHESEVLRKRSLAIFERELPPDDPFLGAGLLGAGYTLISLGRFDEAVDSLTRSVHIYGKMKEVSSKIGWVVRLIGDCHFAQHRYAKAETDYRQSINLMDSLSPGTEKWGSKSLLALARTYAREKRFAEADSIFAPMLESREEHLGPGNLEVADVLDAYTESARLNGSMPLALELSQRAVDIRQKNFVLNARMMTEKDARSYAHFLRRSVDAYLSSFIDASEADSNAIRTTAGIILSTKGQATEQALLRQQSLIGQGDSATNAIADDYRYVRFQLSQAYVGGLQERNPDEFRRKLDSLESKSGDLEAALARRGALSTSEDRVPQIDARGIASSLPARSTLVEYLKFNYVKLDPDTLLPRYIALVIAASGKSNIVDLGPAAQIDRSVEQYREHFNGIVQGGLSADSREEDLYRIIARRLHDLVWQKIEALIKGDGVVFVAPDAGLNLVSFAGLCGSDGRYLIEKKPLHYLSAGRDILRPNMAYTPTIGCIAFGDPDYNASIVERASSPLPIAANLQAGNPFQLRNVRSGCEMFRDLVVPRLPETRTEVKAIGRLWGEQNPKESSQVFVAAMASEEAFKRVSGGKRVIHLATHGYYIESSCVSGTNADESVGENPLLQSGLLLAGANLHGKGAKEAGAEDGILTALEVSALDLRGTDLVVLSACETGLGKVEQGEGVYGLRRAFQMAGAKTVVSSLWQVPDMESMKFMKSLYSMNSQTYPELMQKVASQRIAEARLRGRPTHPFSWGAFVATGAWQIVSNMPR